MPATNDFLPFATGTGANVLTQPEYDALADRLTGMGAGLVPSVKVNKVLRQTTSMAAALAAYIVNATGSDVRDTGDVAALAVQIGAAVAASAGAAGSGGVSIDGLQAQINQLKAGYLQPLNTTDTSRTVLLTDPGLVLRRNASTAMTDTIPAHSTTAIPVGSTVIIRASGAGSYTITPAAGVTLNVPVGNTATARVRHSTLLLHKVAENEWDLSGDLGV